MYTCCCVGYLSNCSVFPIITLFEVSYNIGLNSYIEWVCAIITLGYKKLKFAIDETICAYLHNF